MRVARVDHVQQQRGLAGLGQRRAKRRDELVRQVAHEPDRVDEQRLLAALERQPANRRVERREQLILGDEVARPTSALNSVVLPAFV